MKLSRYNYLKKINNDTVFFNALTCALALVDDNFIKAYSAIENNSFNESEFDKELIDNMKLSGCIIEDNFNELDYIAYCRNNSKYNTNSFALTIAPTLACNFRCKYCFENHSKEVMTDSSQKAILDFSEEYIKNAHDFSVTWYGGEPLLARDIIFSLSEKFQELCKINNVNYNAFIITNGSLIEDRDLELFKKYNIRGAQVTIDGPKEIHDKRRINIKKESTYETIIENINKLLNNEYDVIARVNIDKDNIEYIDDLLTNLKERIDKYSELKIDFGKVSVFTEICKTIESSCFDNEQYAQTMLPLYEKTINMGFTVNKMTVYPTVKFNYCCADYTTSFVVDVNGNLYKCWNHVGNISESCGSVKEKDKIINPTFLKWIQRDPLLFQKCRDCNMLPICMGGCPDLSVKSLDKTPVCDTVKFNLESVIEFYYNHLKDGEENENTCCS